MQLQGNAGRAPTRVTGLQEPCVGLVAWTPMLNKEFLDTDQAGLSQGRAIQSTVTGPATGPHAPALQ